MPTELWRRTTGVVQARWNSLERDWQSVAIGAMIVVSVGLFDLQIPW
ncbi:hypothetical protein [Natrarchaeobaculum aegyptiacum]|nr:hypothetical protein [Natrarchaeobaculum aegyptiacum]